MLSGPLLVVCVTVAHGKAPLKFAFVLLVLGVLLGYQAVTLGGFAWLLFWPACSSLAVSVAYLQGHPALYGKRADGSRNPLSRLLLLPYLVVVWIVWNTYRWASHESPADELLPGLWLGRRLLRGEVAPEITLIVDLTCELSEPRANLVGREYLAFPILDASVPTVAKAIRCVDEILRHSGVTLIHCAQGHGRTGTVAAIILLRTGVAQTPEAAISRLRAVRPKLKLSRRQMAFVRKVAEELKRLPGDRN